MDGSRRLNELSSTSAAQWMNEDKKVNELSSIRVSQWMDDDRTIMSSHCLKVIPCPGSFCQKVIKVVSTITWCRDESVVPPTQNNVLFTMSVFQ
jgi:hypothetical protein